MQRIQEETFGNSLQRSVKRILQKVFIIKKFSIYFLKFSHLSSAISPLIYENNYTEFSEFPKIAEQVSDRFSNFLKTIDNSKIQYEIRKTVEIYFRN